MVTPSSDPARARARILWGVLILVLAGTMGALIGSRLLWRDLIPRSPRASDLPDYGGVADFELTDQSRRPIRRADFDGQPWVADFIFTRCSGPCPLLSAQMARVADSLRTSPVRFASFSVDPERDSPETLARYAANYGADPLRWHFLTGERRIIADLAVNSFHLGMGDPTPLAAGPPADSLYDIPHSLRFALVDRKARIRGYYDGTDDASIARLFGDIRTLLKAPP